MILIDNTVLSNFTMANAIPLLRRFCRGRGMITQAVLGEYQAGLEKRYFQDADISWLRITDLRDARERQRFKRYQARFGAGEDSCLAIASVRKHSLLTDDMSARREEQRKGIIVSGSLGVLITLIHQGYLSLNQGNSTDFCRSRLFLSCRPA